MADDETYIRELRAGQSEQILPDGQIEHPHNRKLRVGVKQIEHGGYIPGAGIFKRQHTIARIPGRDGLADFGPGGKGTGFGRRQQLAQRDVTPRALYPLVGRDVPPEQLPLVGAGDCHCLLQKAAVVPAQGFVLQTGDVFGDDGVLPRGVKHRFAGGGLVAGHLAHGLHPALKQGGHLGVDLINRRTRLLQIIHTGSPFASIRFWFYYTIKRSVSQGGTKKNGGKIGGVRAVEWLG